jgi:hypothetical protein
MSRNLKVKDYVFIHSTAFGGVKGQIVGRRRTLFGPEFFIEFGFIPLHGRASKKIVRRMWWNVTLWKED